MKFEKLRKIISKVSADYADIRYEIVKNTVINFNGKELTRIDSNSTDGYVLRVLKNGGMASVIFTKEEDAEKSIRFALENAQLMTKNRKKPIKLAKTEVVKEIFSPKLDEDPRKIPIAEKLELVKKYNNIPLKYEKIVTTFTGYEEILREKYFVNTDGSEIREDLITTLLYGGITSKEENLVQHIGLSAGGSNGFNSIRNQEKLFEDRTAIVIDLLRAKPVDGGVYTCITNPNLTGVFTHEAFGHYSEADLIENTPSIREKMKIGNKLGNEILNIIDNPTLPNQLGFYKYDDEGVKARPTQLMRNGILVGRLHSRRTANEFEEPISGHCIAEDYGYSPIIRMGTIFIEPGEVSFDELISRVDNGLYLIDSNGGQTAGENFSFGAQYGYVIKNGKLKEMIRDINISGNLYQTLKDIQAIGNDLVLSKVGGCGKGMQSNVRSCYGGPHILINNLVVGGV